MCQHSGKDEECVKAIAYFVFLYLSCYHFLLPCPQTLSCPLKDAKTLKIAFCVTLVIAYKIQNAFLFCFIRFMESELDLHDEILRMHVLATVPEYYPILVKLNATNTLLGLINHENTGMLISPFVYYICVHTHILLHSSMPWGPTHTTH